MIDVFESMFDFLRQILKKLHEEVKTQSLNLKSFNWTSDVYLDAQHIIVEHLKKSYKSMKICFSSTSIWM